MLRPLYPEDDLAGARERLSLFLIQYWGGPTTYSDTRGHPRLRRRHFPFAIGEPAIGAWMAHMTAAVESAGELGHAEREELLAYFQMAAPHMRNT